MAKKAKKVVKKAKVKKTAAKAKAKVLPLVMSQLIGIALKDIRKVEKRPAKFTINMHDWYDPKAEIECMLGDALVRKHRTCSVCAAGSVMAFSLANATQLGKDLDPSDFPKNTDQLNAINCLRTGDVVGAYRTLHHLDYYDTNIPAKVVAFNETYIPDYEIIDPEPFHKAMQELQVKLKQAGL